jgi:hypothetical protein
MGGIFWRRHALQMALLTELENASGLGFYKYAGLPGLLKTRRAA